MARPAHLAHFITELLHQHHLLSASQILEQLRQTGQSYNKTSVYRALENLVSSDQICQHHLSEPEVVYELKSDHHDHAICSNCGSVTAIDCQLLTIPTLPNFQADHHHLTLFGLCANCK